MPASSPAVAPAQGGTITDDILSQLIDIATRLPNQPVSDAEGALLVVSLPGCLEELQNWRQRGQLAAQILTPANVISFPAVR
jgi:hypothetical protein